MRILFAVHGYKPAYRLGGPIISVAALAENLARRGHHVRVVASNSNLDEDLHVPLERPVDVDGVEVLYFRRTEPLQRLLPFVPYVTKSMGFLYSPALRKHLDQIVPTTDLVHTHMPYVYPTYATARAALRHRKPLIYHQRGVFDPRRLQFRRVKKQLYIRAFERPIMRRAAALIALTASEAASYRALGVHTRCCIIPNGVDIARYSSVPSAGFAERWNVPADSTIVLFMSRLHPIKGADKLLTAFIACSEQLPKARLVLAGPDEWGTEAGLRARVRAAGLEQRVVFPGMLGGQDKIDWLARSDIFCLPSKAEGFSMALLEALASSTPLVISPGCNFPEAEQEGAGCIVEPVVGALTPALSRLLTDAPTRRMMATAARRLAERYSWDVITDQMLTVYTQALHRTTGGAAV